MVSYRRALIDMKGGTNYLPTITGGIKEIGLDRVEFKLQLGDVA